jgi:hypothetical protein
MTADMLIVIPTSLHKGSWLEELHEELMTRGILARVREKTAWPGRLDELMIYDIIHWRCWWDGHNMCTAIAFKDDKAYLIMLDRNAENFVRIMDFENVMEEEIRGLIRYSECLEKYGYDFPC